MTPRVVLLCTGVLAGCAAQAPAADSGVKTAADGVLHYMPLVDNMVYSYKTYSELNQDNGILVLEVRRQKKDTVDLYLAGKVQRLRVDASGIRHLTGGYLLKAPLRQGASWTGQFGTVTITKIGDMELAEGDKYQDCIETVEEVPGKKATTVFCGGIGMVSLEVVGQSGDDVGVERAVLHYHGPKIDLTESSK